VPEATAQQAVRPIGEGGLRRSVGRIEDIVAEQYHLVVETGGKEFAEEFRTMINGVSTLERDHLGYTIALARKP
jgi:hypothetical protein